MELITVTFYHFVLVLDLISGKWLGGSLSDAPTVSVEVGHCNEYPQLSHYKRVYYTCEQKVLMSDGTFRWDVYHGTQTF